MAESLRVRLWSCVDDKDSTPDEVKKIEHAKKPRLTDFEFVMKYGHVGREEAIRALELTEGDIVDAITHCTSD